MSEMWGRFRKSKWAYLLIPLSPVVLIIGLVYLFLSMVFIGLVCSPLALLGIKWAEEMLGYSED